MIIIPKLISGLTPLMLDSHTLRFECGIAAVSGFTPSCYIENASNTELSILTIGPWGLDRPLWVGWAYLWGIADSTGILPGALILSSASLGGGVIIPTGYDRLRMLPYAVYIKGSSAGLRLQIVTSWPSPARTQYQDVSTTHEIVVPTTNGAWVDLPLNDLVPDGTRVVELMVYSETVSGAGGNVWLRTGTLGDGGFAVGPEDVRERRVILSSTEVIKIRTSTACRARVRVIAYELFSTY